MYKNIVITTKRSYAQAEAYITEKLRTHILNDMNHPRIVPIEATRCTPRYYSVVIRDHITSDRRW